MGDGYGVYRSRDPDTLDRIAPLRADGTGQDASILGTLHEFATALQENRRPQSDARDNLRTLAMAFAASRASREGGSVEIDGAFFPEESPAAGRE